MTIVPKSAHMKKTQLTSIVFLSKGTPAQYSGKEKQHQWKPYNQTKKTVTEAYQPFQETLHSLLPTSSGPRTTSLGSG